MPRKTNEESYVKHNSSVRIKDTTAEKKLIKNKKSSKIAATKSSSKSVAKSKATTVSKSKKNDSSKSLKTNNSKSTSAKKTSNTKKVTPKLNLIEYYDLPYRYNKTIVKILAQTPKRLFVYWDISDADRNNYKKEYGLDFFNNTKPVLVIHNTTKNYSFEIEINDFANSWYFDINDEKCEYIVELGRRPRSNNISLSDDYLHITSSNKVEAPNNHILFEKEQKIVYFRNVKTNEQTSKALTSLNLLRYMGKSNPISMLYNKIYKGEEFLDLRNPSSNNPTSKF